MKRLSALFVTLSPLLIASCASTKPVTSEIPLTANPSEEVQKLEADLTQGRQEQLDVLAPDSFKQAQDDLKDAKDNLKDKDDAADVLKEVASSRAYLNRAREVAKASTGAMSEVVEARRLALSEGAHEAFKDDFKKADKDLVDVTEEIEDGDMGKVAKKRTEVLNAYLDLEVRAIKNNAIGGAYNKLEQARKADAKKWAPRTLVEADKSYRDAEAYILANRHNKAEIAAMSAKANADADKALRITEAAKRGDDTSSEELALRMEDERMKTAQKQAELSNTQAALSADQAFNAQFEAARAAFSPSEAEVYRQGNTLILRLRSLEFDSAKSSLKPANFALLSKVQDVIGKMDAKSVQIEGHTDSRGSAKLNEKLSSERANAVKSYLETNLPSEEKVSISAVGYGFQRPLADNKSEEGRAQNRRVDIVINPSTEATIGR